MEYLRDSKILRTQNLLMFTVSYLSRSMNDKKIMAIALVGIVTSLVIFTAYEMSYAKNCSGFPIILKKALAIQRNTIQILKNN